MDECSPLWVTVIEQGVIALIVVALLAFAYIYFVLRRDVPRQREESDRGQDSGD